MQVGNRAIAFNVPAIPAREIGSQHGKRAVTKKARTKVRRQGKRECQERD